jgi:signal transduction histidine kinase
VILADQQETFDRLRLAAAQADSKLLLIGPHGRAAPITDPALAAALAGSEQGGPLSSLVTAMQAGQSGVMKLSREQARGVGFLGADAVAAFAPIRTADAGHWSIAVLDSTATLEAQGSGIVHRMAVLALVFALALGALSVYLVVSSRRAIEVQERLRTAEEIARVRERAEKILENVPVAVVVLDYAGRISGLNVAFRERLASARVGDSLDVAFPAARPGAVDTLRAVVERARSSGTVQALVAQPIALTGGGRVFAAHAVPLPNPLPDMTLLVVLEDVTELQALGSQLLRAEKLATVGVLAAGIAHEVGTPLGVVRGRTEMLASWLGPAHPQARTTGVILDEIDRISRTIHQLLDFARVAQAEVAPVDLAGVVSSVVDLLAFEARKRKVSLDVELPEAMPPLSANADQLKQVLVNLSLNGLDACEAGGTVTLRALRGGRGGLAVLEVEDNGAGIPESLKHRVFDPFFTTKKRGKGTGLGLSIAAQIVRNHGGEIDLDSAAGRGTRVTVKWPLVAASEERNGTAERRANPRS